MQDNLPPGPRELSDEELLELSVSPKRMMLHCVLITPDVAKTLLDFNNANRTMRASVVDKYAHDMAQGRWRYTHQGLAMSSAGNILDGQHRLAAAAKANIPFLADITFGMPPEAFGAIDAGAKRTTADTLTVRGFKDGNALAAVLRCLHGIRTTSRGHMNFTPSVGLLTDELEFWPMIEDAVKAGRRIQKHGGIKGFGAGYMAGLCLVMRDAPEPAGDIPAFIAKIETGIGIQDDFDPVYQLRRQCRSTARGYAPHESAAMLIKTWNAYRRRQRMQLLKWMQSEAFPTVTNEWRDES